MNASICKPTLFIMAVLLFCSSDKDAWSQTPGGAPQDRTSGAARPSPDVPLCSFGEDKIKLLFESGLSFLARISHKDS